jgi:hypothetical protein
MRLMVGFTWQGARQYALDRKWTIHNATRAFTTDEGDRVIYAKGNSTEDYFRITSLPTITEVIRGPLVLAEPFEHHLQAVLKNASHARQPVA